MDLPGFPLERRGGFWEQESLQEMDVQMFLEALLANHLPVLALGCFWELSVAPSSGWSSIQQALCFHMADSVCHPMSQHLPSLGKFLL